jgi:hypothetical protein
MPQTSKVSGVKTVISRDSNGNQFVQYHYTRVVEWNSREIILNTGGWETPTTKNRMNQTSNQFNLGFSVYQKNHNWYVSYKGEDIKFEGDKVVLDRTKPFVPKVVSEERLQKAIKALEELTSLQVERVEFLEDNNE